MESVLKRIRKGCVFKYAGDYYRFVGDCFEMFDMQYFCWSRDSYVSEMLLIDLMYGRKLEVEFIENWKEVKKKLKGE